MDGCLHLDDLFHVRDEGVAYTTLRARMHGFEFERFVVLPADSMRTGRGLLRYIASLQLYADAERANAELVCRCVVEEAGLLSWHIPTASCQTTGCPQRTGSG